MWVIILGVVLVIVALVYRHLTKYYGYLEGLGIPVLKPISVFGSPPIGAHKYVVHELYLEWFKKFGKTFGRYDGITPCICTIDPEIIKSVLVKNFDSFTDVLNLQLKDRHTTLDMSSGETWRELRKTLSPTFTSGRLKSMLEPMVGVADDAVAFVDELFAKNNVVDFKLVFQGLSLSTIARCAFGIETDAFHNPDQDLLKYGVQAFQAFRVKNWFEAIIFKMFTWFPGFERLVPLIPPAYDKLFDITKDIMQGRAAKGIHQDDFLGRLMEMIEVKKENPNSEFLRVLNEDIITGQGIVFFLAGYETTANTLSTLSYNLAMHQDVQDRVYEEIKEVTEAHDGKIDHDTIMEMEYLEAALNENLRCYGPAAMHDRTCVKDCEIKPGLLVKKGMTIEMPIYASHHYPEYFPKPDEFIPERFIKGSGMDDIPSFTYRPFGGGPRVCIGQRFAQVEMKLAMAKLLSKYKLLACPETQLDLQKGDLFLLSFPDMKLKVELRET